jgi:uncharacterized protein YybS (DUF2232 family)
VSQVERRPEGIKIYIQYIFFLSLLFILPGVQWPLFFWLNGCIPLAVFLILYGFGRKTGSKILMLGMLIACGMSFILQSFPLLLFSLVALPAGFVIAGGVTRSEDHIVTGAKGVICLGLSGLLFWGGLIASDGAFSYAGIIQQVQQGMDAALEAYKSNTAIPVDKLLEVDQIIRQAKSVFPVILPAIVGNIVISTIWLTMVGGNRLAFGFFKRRPWPEYKIWKLPDSFIWLGIASALLALLPAPVLQPVGINCLLMVGIIYMYQGIAVLVFFCDKWKIPFFFRLPLYTLAVIQSAGALLLTIAGIADTWLDFRKIRK